MNRNIFIAFMTVATLFSVNLLSGCDQDSVVPDQQCAESEGACLYARSSERYFEVYDGNSWEKLVVKGVNIGTSLPGRWYTEFPADRELYKQWFSEIASMNANAIRIYTLLDPAFYAVLDEYNQNPENDKLWLFQEIWPDDLVPDLNLHDPSYRDEYKLEIKLVIDALHGNADIPARLYRAYGNYTADVTPYLLGIMIGRELEPDEVKATDEANPELEPYQGSYISNLDGASPTEAWLAEMCDYTAAYSDNQYGMQYPVGFVSWPTLDPLTHPTEWDAEGNPGYNDREVVDPNIFNVGHKNHAGFFGAYHIYPNYPDFMNNEPAFAEYSDDKGVFRYKGYLDHFMAIHPSYPALVAEFGISTSLNTSHFNPEGLHHGGLSEKEQGDMVVRMMRSIIEEGYAGGLIFEWSDEWAKKTWNTEPFMVPWERQVLWQNAMCPEQKYGLLSVEPLRIPQEELLESWHDISGVSSYNPVENRSELFGRVDMVEAGTDEAFFYMALSLSDQTASSENEIPWDQIGLAVGIDIGMPDAGESKMPFAGLPDLPGRVQFMIDLQSPEEALLLAIPSYNRGKLNFEPQNETSAHFEPIEAVVNRERVTEKGLEFPALYSNESILRYGNFNPEHAAYSSYAHWYVEESGIIMIRLPWMLLNISDPSMGTILRDSRTYTELPVRDELNTEQGQGFRFYVATYYKQDQTRATGLTGSSYRIIDFFPRKGDSFDQTVDAYRWNTWEKPQYQFRLKESFETIADYFETIG